VARQPGVMPVLLLGLFVAAGFYLYANARELTEFDWRIRPGWFLIAAVIVILAGPLLRTWLWQRVLLTLGHAVPFLQCFRIVRLSQLAKYLPGQVWHFVGTFYWTHKVGVTKSGSLGGMLYDNGISFIAGGITVAILVGFAATSFQGHVAVWVIVGANLLVGTVLSSPSIFNMIAKPLARIARKSPPPQIPVMRAKSFVMLLVVNVGFWFMLGGALYFLVRGVTSPAIPFADAVVIGSIGIMAGFVVPLAPSGIGVTEGIMVSLLGGYFPLEVALVIALLFRVLNVSKEIVLGLVAAGLAARGIGGTAGSASQRDLVSPQ